MPEIKAIVFDCERAAPLARFWAAVLDGYDIRPYDDAEIAKLAKIGRTPETDPVVMVDGPGPEFCFQEVPERKPGKNRLHFDFVVADRRAEIERLLALGASVYEEHGERTVMRDPEGNEFCVEERS